MGRLPEHQVGLRISVPFGQRARWFRATVCPSIGSLVVLACGNSSVGPRRLPLKSSLHFCQRAVAPGCLFRPKAILTTMSEKCQWTGAGGGHKLAMRCADMRILVVEDEL